MSDRLVDGRAFRILTAVDQYGRECLLLEADTSMSGTKVVSCLHRLSQQRALPNRITVDNGSEFYSKAMDAWAYGRSARIHSTRQASCVKLGLNTKRGALIPSSAFGHFDRRSADSINFVS
jgi:putative transposase